MNGVEGDSVDALSKSFLDPISNRPRGQVRQHHHFHMMNYFNDRSLLGPISMYPLFSKESAYFGSGDLESQSRSYWYGTHTTSKVKYNVHITNMSQEIHF